MAIDGNNVIKYTILPGVFPRVKDFLRSGFSFLAGIIAVIYGNVGLLPPNHSYLNAQNYGRFGIRHVIAEAANNLTFDRKHLDQIILFFTILMGLGLVVVQIFLVILSVASTPVMASTLYSIFLTTPIGHTPSQDIAFIVLDKVFGVMASSGTGSTVGFYNSCVADLGTPCLDMKGIPIASPTVYPTPMQLALHSMLHFYTLGIVFIAGVIILYYITSIIGETVTTGTPFGRRFNRAWAVPRLIAFFALIAPISTAGNNAGINVAQLFVFASAKYGSNMATNVWLNFNDAAVGTVPEFLGERKEMVAYLRPPESGGLTQFMHLVRLCIVAEKVVNGIDIYPYLIRPHNDDTTPVSLHTGAAATFANMGGTTNDYLDYFAGTSTLENAAIFSRYNTIILRFGHRNPPQSESADPSGVAGAPATQVLEPNQRFDAYTEHWAYVEPTCGELQFDLTSLDKFIIGPAPGGVYGIQENFYEAIWDYLGAEETAADETVMCMIKSTLPYDQDPACIDQSYSVSPPRQFVFTSPTKLLTVNASRADIELFDALNEYYINGLVYDWTSLTASLNPYTMEELLNAVADGTYKGNLLMPSALRERGWAAAALWYNRIAELNGVVSAAMQNMPRVFVYPKVMEQIADQHKTHDANFSYGDRFNPRLQNGKMADLPRPGDQYLAALYYSDFKFWTGTDVQETVFTRSSKNAVIDFINTVFGTNGLLNIYDNKGAHPLAMLSSAGKSIVDASLRNLFAGIIGQGIGEILSDEFIGKLGQAGGEFLVQFSLITLSIGFMLYYVLPILPFIYFFFAFSGWIKSIFEAVVAMPLWALAHIKIDGEGLPGPLATNGYFLLFEILLRPTLIIVGLLASIALFTALVDTLHEVFELLVFTATGYDMKIEIFFPATVSMPGGDSIDYWRSPIDELFYTVIYVVLVYMIGLSCFKLVDEIPNAIMRWMGVTVSTFQETAGDPAGKLASQMYRSTQMANAQVTTMIARMKGGNSSAVQDQAVIQGLA